MRAVQRGPLAGLIGQLVLLAVLAGTVGLTASGWLIGIACAVVTNTALARGLAKDGLKRLGPANRVTLIRATLVGGVAALIATSLSQPISVPTLVGLTSLALVLDAFDGWVARRTETVSALGGRFDMEVDAFLIFVLSVYVAQSVGVWVLALGAARYVYVAAGWLLPWLRNQVPYRYWRKVVAAIVAIVLTVAAADVLPSSVTTVALVVALVLLAESFGRDVWWLWRQPRSEPTPSTAASTLTTMLAVLLVWFALVAPNELDKLSPGSFVRIPLEALLFVGVLFVLPPKAGRVAAVVVGITLGVLAILKTLNMGFSAALGRPFDPLVDWRYFGSAVGVLGDSIGRTNAVVATVAISLAAVAVLVFLPLSVLRLTRILGTHRAASLRVSTALGVVWALCALAGLQLVPGVSLASASAASLTVDEVAQVYAGIKDQQAFEKTATVDAFRDTAGSDLLTGLRGKDVVFVFVESYGQVAVQGSAFSPQVDSVLDTGTGRLRADGYSVKSGFLTSPTFGGISWLAHSTLQSGLWIDNQLRYDDLVASDRFTLSDAFKRAGWRTVSDVPSDSGDWPEGTSFYHYDKLYNSSNVGYVGPKFSYASVPDQYTLSAFQRLELAQPNRAPVMAEIDLVSSHTPWAPLPRLIDPSQLSDGSAYNGMPEQGQAPADVWPDPSRVQSAYARSIEYSMRSVISFVKTSHDKNLVVVVLGDHQPASIVSGQNASHNVPISIISHDQAVLNQISPWHWQDGLRPSPDAPVWPMDAFRDRFLTAYGPQSR